MITALTKNIPNSEKKILIYCRESVDQNGVNYERIETQRDILLSFSKKNGYTNIVDVILHDDVSGTDFSRFKDIEERILRKEIDTLLMKDDSRLGRNQIEALKFVEFLADNDIELVFESTKYDSEIFPILAFFNERRAKEDSFKIKRVLHHKMDEGTLLITAPFGYIKAGKELIIDVNVSWIIKKIFELYSEGNGYWLIAKYLNGNNIPSPSQYKNNTKMFINEWTTQSILKIINNPIYVGKIAYHKTIKPSFKSKKIKKISKEDWQIVEGKHEPIISVELYERVQNILKDKQIFGSKSKIKSKFSGYVICGKCKTNMYVIHRKDRVDFFICGVNAKKGKEFCSTHHITEKEIEEFINNLIVKFYKNNDLQDKLNERAKKNEQSKSSVNNTIKKLEINLSKLQNQFKELYNDKLNGDVPEFIYKDKSKELQNNINLIERQLEKLINEQNNNELNAKNFEVVKRICENILKIGLTKEMIDTILEKIVIYEENEITEMDRIEFELDNQSYEYTKLNGGIILKFKGIFKCII